jgi:hypothetical protein
MTEKTETIDLLQFSSAQLEALLAEKIKIEREGKLKAKVIYEDERDLLIEQMVKRAKILNDQMRDFKQWSIGQLEAFRNKAAAYGDIRSNSKGGFSLRHRTTQEMVSLDRNSIPEYDERAASAETLIKEFLEDKVKKKDIPTYRTIAALLERNKQGDMSPSRIASLLKVKDNYDDPRWIKAMELFEESFRIREISYSVSFFRKNPMQKDIPIVLTFASIPVYSAENPPPQAK